MGCNEAVLKYLRDENRPFSCNDITQNLHKQFGKAAIQKALDYHVAKRQVLEKTYGKQKIYAIVQGKFDKQNFELQQKELQDRHDTTAAQVAEAESLAKKLEGQLKQLKESMLNSDLKRRIAELQATLKDVNEDVKRIRGNNQQGITEDSKRKLEEDILNLEKEWRKRRRIAQDMLGEILENYPDTKQKLYEEIGIELDEEAGVTVPPPPR